MSIGLCPTYQYTCRCVLLWLSKYSFSNVKCTQTEMMIDEATSPTWKYFLCRDCQILQKVWPKLHLKISKVAQDNFDTLQSLIEIYPLQLN